MVLLDVSFGVVVVGGGGVVVVVVAAAAVCKSNACAVVQFTHLTISRHMGGWSS